MNPSDFHKGPKKCFLALLLLLGACDFTPDHIDLPKWQGEVLGPLVKNRAEAKEIIGANTFRLQHDFTMEDLGYKTGTRQIIEAIDTSLGPFELKVSDVFERLDIDNGPLKLRLENELPVGVLEGTVFVLRDEVNGRVLFEYELKNLVPSGESGYEIEIPADVLQEISGQTVYFSVETFLTEGSEELVLITEEQRLGISFSLGELDYSLAVARESKDLTFTSRADFRLKGQTVESQPVEGTFRLFVENRLPIQWRVQAYFWNQDQTVVLDSLFNEPAVIESAKLDGSGLAVSPVESDFSVDVNPEKVNRINDAHYITTYFQMAVTGENQTVTIQKSDYLAFQLVGKFQVDVEAL